MPFAAPKPCGHAGCGVLVRGGGSRCERHAHEAWVKRPEVTKRVTGRKLQRLRDQLFAADPLCVECRAAGRVKLATVRDHIKPLAEGGLDELSNTQGLCSACHDFKSAAESARGRRRHG